jgi:hypothetical protein
MVLANEWGVFPPGFEEKMETHNKKTHAKDENHGNFLLYWQTRADQ